MTYIDVISYIKGCVWTPLLQEQLHGEIEPNNSVDKYAVAVKKDLRNSWASTIKEKMKNCINDFLLPSS